MDAKAKELITKFNDLYKKTMRITDPEDLTLAEIRRLMFEMVDIIFDMTRLEIVPHALYMKWEQLNKKKPLGSFNVFLIGSASNQSWSDLDYDPLPLWRSYQDSLIVFVKEATRYLTPAPEKFTWKGLTVNNPIAVSEGVTKRALDALNEGMELLKRRGLEDALYASLKSINFVREGSKFKGQATGKDYTSAGYYTEAAKTITLVISQVDADQNSRQIKRWFTEIFLHELGHHIHMSYITREAKEFWDSGWDFVNEAKRRVAEQTVVDLKDIAAYSKGLGTLKWDFQAYGRKLKGFDRAKYLVWLFTSGISTTVTQVRLTKYGLYVQYFSRDHANNFMYDDTEALEEALAVYRDRGYPLLRGLPDYVQDYMRDGGGPLDSEFREAVSDYMLKELGQEGFTIWTRFISKLPLKIPVEIMDDLVKVDSGIHEAVQDAIEALGIPSDYGKENFLEDFAETFVLFVAAPDRLSSVARWRMGRTLGISEAGGKKVLRLSKKAAMISRIVAQIISKG